MTFPLWLFLVAAQTGVRPAAKGDTETPAQEFRRIGESLYAGDCPTLGRELREQLEKVLTQPALSQEQRGQCLLDLGREYLEAGQVTDAIVTLTRGLELAEGLGRPKMIQKMHRRLAMAYLRQAENLNCIERHNAQCCVFPIGDGGLHSMREPAEKAREHYQAVLAATPDDLAARWVLNLVAMLLGEHPDGVPSEMQIPPGAFAPAPEGGPTFRDVAPQAGVAGLNLAGGVAVEDYDGDGWLDILTSTCDPLGSLLYYRNLGDGTFENLSESSHAAEQLGGLNMISGDYDNDGDQDALVLRGGWLLDYGRIRKSLLRNDEGKTFVDVTRAAGVADPAFPTQTAVFGDFDGDGWLDLYVGCESRVEIEQGQGNYPSQMYKSKRDGTFTEVGDQAGVRNNRYAKGIAAGDYDDDGDLDVYVSNLEVNRLYRNDGRGRFEDVAQAAKVEEPIGRSFACWFFDYDNDGGLDLWVGAYSSSIGDLAAEALGQPFLTPPPCLYRNARNGTFENVTKALGLARPLLPMGSNFGDVDHDGWLDIYLGTGNPDIESLMPDVFFRNDGGKRFVDETASSGLGHLQKGHGIAFADFDHDGDEDIYHQLGGFIPVDRYQSALFENTGKGGHWLYLSLAGTKANRDAVGARIKVQLSTPSGAREVHRALGSVSSFGGSPHRLEIGLGDATKIERLEIRWPGTKEPQVFADVPLDSYLRIVEGRAELERVELATFHF